jgi:hypothetical protein
MKRTVINVLICLVYLALIVSCGAGFSGIPQNGYNLVNANDEYCNPCRSHLLGDNQINQNLNQNALGIGGFGGSGFGPGGLVWIPQNGINIANANGWNNHINQGLNQNGYGF